MTTTSAFPAMGMAHPLEAIEQEIHRHAARGERVQIVFDLDDTLFLVRPRKRAIFRELSVAFAHDVAVGRSLAALAEGDICYDVREALNGVGIHADEHVGAIKDAFFARFFDGGYTVHDALNEGAAEYVTRLHAAGARIVYLSGRPEEMLPRTLQTLADQGFPVDEATTATVLKGAQDPVNDVAFKAAKAVELAAWGKTVAVFDNEPANLNAMRPAMPEAAYVLLDTDHSPNPPALEMDAHVLTDFARERARLSASLAATPSFRHGGWSLEVAAESRV
jgi:phosphoglycolate phosphatase-like HAD superfamily hydrolase